MAAEQVLSLSIKVNTDTGALEVLGTKFKETSEAGAKAESSFAGLTKGAGALLAAFGITASIGAFVSFLKEAVSQATADEEAMNRLRFAVEAQGNSWEKAKGPVKAWSEAIQEQTRFSNTDALDTLGKLSTATHSVAQAQQAAQVAMGLSVAKAIPLNEATDIMQGLMMGNSRAVLMAHKTLGEFTDGATTAQGVLNALNSHFSNLARTEEGAAKSQAQFKNAWDDFAKMIGNALMPAVTTILNGMTDLMNQTTKWAVVTKNAFMISLEAAKLYAKVTVDVLTGSWVEAYKDATQAKNNLVALWNAAEKQFEAIEKKKTQKHKSELDTQTGIDAQKSVKDLAHEQEQALKVETIHAELQKKIQAMGVETFTKKLAIEEQDYELEKAKIIKEIEDEEAKFHLLGELEDEHVAKKLDLMRLEAQRQHTLALDTANTTLEGLAIVNSMMDQDSKGQVDRAIMILALEKAIAIARIWSSPTIAIPGYGMALAAAQTAVLVAQFAQQSQSISRAAAAHQQQANTSAITTTSVTDLGGGTLLQQTDGDIPLGSTQSQSGIVVGSAPAAPAAGSGQTINVNIPQIIVNVAVDTLQVADRRAILQALADELRSGTVDSIRFAVTSANLAASNAQVAV